MSYHRLKVINIHNLLLYKMPFCPVTSMRLVGVIFNCIFISTFTSKNVLIYLVSKAHNNGKNYNIIIKLFDKCQDLRYIALVTPYLSAHKCICINVMAYFKTINCIYIFRTCIQIFEVRLKIIM